MCKQVGPAKVWNNESKSENKASRSPTASPKKSVSELLGENNKSKASRSPTAPSKKSVPELVGENKSRSRSRSSTPSKKQAEAEERAAFRGAKFDKAGFCINHSKVQLANPIRGDDGKIVYQELKTFCRSCQSAKHKSKRGTSLSGGTVREAPRRPNMSPGKKSSTRSRSRSIERKKKPVFSTPFDEKGRCHYHKNVQLAGKKMTGGWKVIYPICPKCMEDKLEEDGDDRSVKSSKSSRSSRSSLSLGSRGNAHGQYDKNGCCVIHKHVQVAKKKVFGNGFKVLRVCPACTGGENISMDDAVSVSSHSVSSRRSSRSAVSVSTSSRGKKVTSSRYGALPFDGEGYCCQHPSVQMAHKKMMGGFKILMDVCPECAADGGIKPKKKSARRNGTGRIYDDSGSECSSVISGISGASSVSMKKVRVTNMKLTDEDGKVGKYSGYVNDEYKPHGNGTIKYTDGSAWKGVWNEGSQVHGKSTKSRSRSKSRN